MCALYCRLCLLPRPSATFAAADNPPAHETSWKTRSLTLFYLPVANLRLLLWPQHLSFDWGMDAVPLIRTLWDARNILSAGLYASLFGLLWTGSGVLKKSSCMGFSEVADISLPLVRRLGDSSCHTWMGLTCHCHHQVTESSQPAASYNSASFAASKSPCFIPALLMCVAFLVLPFLPASNLLFYVGFTVAERVLYLPSVGYCLLFGYGFGSIWRRAHSSRRCKALLLCILGVLLGSHGLRTVRRNLDWRDEEQLFRSAISINPPKGEYVTRRRAISVKR